MEEYADEESSSSDGESEEEDRLRYEELMEEMLERSHKQQAWRAGELRKREEDLPALKKHRLEDGAEEIGADGVDAERLARASAAVSKRLKRTEEVGDGGLVVEFDEGRVGVASSKAAMARQWFADDEMKKVLGAAGLDDEEEEEEEESEEGRDVVENGVELTDSDEEEEREINRLKEAVKEGGKGGAKGKGGKGERDGFEVVRAESPEMDSGSESSDSEDEFETLPDSDKAEVRMTMQRSRVGFRS